MFTQFMDMHSGGDTKIPPYEYIYIEAPYEEAISIFSKRFNRDPYNITCRCCGEDYSVSCEESLDVVTAYERGCNYSEGKYELNSARISLDEYCKRSDILVIRKQEI